MTIIGQDDGCADATSVDSRCEPRVAQSGEETMARPRVFVSSTYYDLRHVRGSLETFIESLGYEPVLSEKGDIAYAPNIALDESCYRDAASSDVLVLIVGGRYGAERSDSRTTLPHGFFDRYDSITKLEYIKAIENNVPVYILVDAQVYAEYQTFQQNRENQGVTYAHVDSVNIFNLIEDILLQRRNNALNTFWRYAEIEDWLREQWAGLFGEFLRRTRQSQQVASLSVEVSQASEELSKTFKPQLETSTKSSDTWNEVAIGSILDEALSPDQFARNIEVRPRSNQRVDFAIKLPGIGETQLWLPIDARYPAEDYERLREATKRSDILAAEAAVRGIEARVRSIAKDIRAKYVAPPHTTEFAVMFLPTERLFAEVIRRPGLVDWLQSECRVIVAGPAALVSLLTSMRIGFSALAIQQSSVVWQVLSAVKTEFEKFGDTLDRVHKKLDEAQRMVEEAGVRRRAVDRKLRGVEVLREEISETE
jgi:hypothetical protein